MNEREFILVTIVLAALAGYGVWGLIQWVRNAPSRPEPWDDSVSAEVERDEAPALCHRCLEPHGPLDHFCSVCGAPVGEYTNIMPFEYLYSLGHELRIGTSGDYRKSPLTVIGFVFLSLVQYSVFSPVYLYRLLKNLPHKGLIGKSNNDP